jgi:prepilin-type N-terminal cleavage/methylation domain-containing protein
MREMKQQDAGGFTLLEVLVALTIMGAAVSIILQLFAADLRALSASEDYVAATVAGERKLEELLGMSGLKEKSWSETGADGFRMDVTVSETMSEKTENLPVKLLLIDLTVRWRRGLHERAVQLRTIRMADKPVMGETGMPSSQ